MVQTISDSTVFSDSSSYSLAFIAATTTVNDISPGNDEEYNEKEIDNIYLRYRQYGSTGLNTDDSTFIAKLAWSCPYTDGEAVYKARSLYVIYNPPAYFDNSLLCGGDDDKGGGKGRFISGNSSTDIRIDDFRIFPNPSNGTLNIIYPSAGRVEIINSMGQVVRTEILPAEIKSVVIDLGNVAPGLYTYRYVSNNNEVVKAGKLTLLQ